MVAEERCPAATVCPALTLTAVTWPDTAKFRSEVSAGWSVPDTATVWRNVPVETVTSRETVLGAASAR